MNIIILGANGYIGRSLIEKLLSTTEHTVVALSRSAELVHTTHPRLIKHNIDVFDTELLHQHLKNADCVYYLLHMMGQNKRDFAQAETDAAASFIAACKDSTVKRIIYLGGLGDDKDTLSKHLKSRHDTGKTLQSGPAQVIEFRASMIIGNGSISYDIVTNLIHKLPILTLPKWAKTLTQPIGLDDALSYLIAALYLDTHEHLIVEIGGPTQLSYGDLMKRYAAWRNKKMLIIKFHLIPVSVAAWWLNLFTPPNHAKVGRVMVESLSNPMVVTNDGAQRLFPAIHPQPIEKVFV